MDYDLIVLGAGQAAIPLARAAAGKGWRVAIAERKHLGGSCINFGCTPTKAAIASARVAHLARRAAEFGVSVSDVRVDFGKVLGRARAIVAAAQESLARGLHEAGVTVLHGHARLTGHDGGVFTVAVDGQTVRAKRVVIDTGTRTTFPPISGLDGIDVIHAGNWLEHQQLPEHVVFAGAGTIALEMAQFYRRMGARVTVVGSKQQVAEREDADVAGELQRLLEGEGVAFQLGARVEAVSREGSSLHVTARSSEGTKTIIGSHLFVAVGRRPNTDDLGLEAVGLQADEHGVLKVDERLATAVPDLWAAGDVRGGPMFTHTAWDDYRVLESQLLGDGTRTTAGRIVPYGVFTDPELGRVGLSETEARKQHGDSVVVARFDMGNNGKAAGIGEASGFIKLVADKRDGGLLGATVLAADGAELLAAYITLMNAGVPLRSIADAIYPHPTLSEAMQSAATAAQSALADAAIAGQV